MNPLSRIVTAALTVPAFASPVLAAGPNTRLVSCQSGSCLVISGHRDNPSAGVLINGHVVAVEGQRNWQARLDLDTVRAWSEPLARTLVVETVDFTTASRAEQEARLPIGLLGHADLDTVLIALK